MSNDLTMSEIAESTTWNKLTLFAGDFRARTYQLPADAKVLLENGLDYGSSLLELLTNLSRNGLLSKTSPVFYPAIKDEILPSSFDRWQSAGMAFAGGCLTLSISDSPSGASVCSLSEVLEMDAPRKYYLSAKACAGILRRSERRGKLLPPFLQTALEQVVQQAQEAKRNFASQSRTP